MDPKQLEAWGNNTNRGKLTKDLLKRDSYTFTTRKSDTAKGEKIQLQLGEDGKFKGADLGRLYQALGHPTDFPTTGRIPIGLRQAMDLWKELGMKFKRIAENTFSLTTAKGTVAHLVTLTADEEQKIRANAPDQRTVETEVFANVAARSLELQQQEGLVSREQAIARFDEVVKRQDVLEKAPSLGTLRPANLVGELSSMNVYRSTPGSIVTESNRIEELDALVDAKVTENSGLFVTRTEYNSDAKGDNDLGRLRRVYTVYNKDSREGPVSIRLYEFEKHGQSWSRMTHEAVRDSAQTLRMSDKNDGFKKAQEFTERAVFKNEQELKGYRAYLESKGEAAAIDWSRGRSTGRPPVERVEGR